MSRAAVFQLVVANLDERTEVEAFECDEELSGLYRLSVSVTMHEPTARITDEVLGRGAKLVVRHVAKGRPTERTFYGMVASVDGGAMVRRDGRVVASYTIEVVPRAFVLT